MQFGTEAGEASLDEQLEFYLRQGMVLITLDKFVQDHHFIFTESILTKTRERRSKFLSITKEHGNSANEWPGIWRDFEFEFYEA